MARGFNKLMSFLKLPDEEEFEEEYYDDEYDYNDQKELEKEEKRMKKEQRKEEKRNQSFAFRDRDQEEDSYDREENIAPRKPIGNPRPKNSKVVQMPTAENDMEVCIVKPSTVSESQQVCTLLLNSTPVVVNLEGIDIDEAQRIMDFISGCIFSIDGNMCQVSRYIFIFSPKDIDISGDYIKSLENDESYNIAAFHKEF